MATRKTTTRGKTKTSKKPATKKVSSRSAVVTTRGRAASKKVVAKSTAKVSKAGQTDVATRNRLALGAILSVLVAGLAGYFMNHMSFQLVTALLTKDELLSKTSAVFVPAVHAVFDVELRWLVVTVLLLSAVTPLLALTRLKSYYLNSVKTKNNKLRWLDMAVVSTLMIETIALISGINDLMTLKVIGGLVVTTCVLGYLAEQRNEGVQKPHLGIFYLSIFTGVLPWLMIAVAAIGTILWGGVRAPWYVYALYTTTLLGFGGYIMTQMQLFRGLNSYDEAERKYLQINMFTRIAFGLILVVGLMK